MLVKTIKIGGTQIEIYDDYIKNEAYVKESLERIGQMALPALQRAELARREDAPA